MKIFKNFNKRKQQQQKKTTKKWKKEYNQKDEENRGIHQILGVFWMKIKEDPVKKKEFIK